MLSATLARFFQSGFHNTRWFEQLYAVVKVDSSYLCAVVTSDFS
jgi:hypothetical protein